MKLSEFENLTYQQLNRMPVDQLKQLVSEQGKKLNKRVSRIRSSSQTSKTAVSEVMESGGKFGVRGLTVTRPDGKIDVRTTKMNLIREAKREQKFQKAKSGTYRGAVKEKEQSVRKVLITSGDDYTKAKAKEWRDEQKEKMGKRKWDKMTKKERSQFYRESRKYGDEKRKDEYDKRIGEAWDDFHKWKESHPAQAFSYPKDRVKSYVNEYGVEGGKTDFDKFMSITKRAQKSDENKPDVWTTVGSTPFDQQETPRQYKVRS